MRATRIIPLAAAFLFAVSQVPVGAADGDQVQKKAQFQKGQAQKAQPGKGQFQKGQLQKGQLQKGQLGQLQFGQLQQGFGRGGALLSAEAIEKLKLTAEQKQKYDTISTDYADKQKANGEKLREAFQSKDQDKIKTALESLKTDGTNLRNDCLGKVEAFLTAEQKTVFQEVKNQQPRPGFGGIGGGGTPGTLLSSGVQDRLKLTDEQKKKIEELQKEVDGKLNSIFTEEQRKQFDELKKGGGRPARPAAPAKDA